MGQVLLPGYPSRSSRTTFKNLSSLAPKPSPHPCLPLFVDGINTPLNHLSELEPLESFQIPPTLFYSPIKLSPGNYSLNSTQKIPMLPIPYCSSLVQISPAILSLSLISLYSIFHRQTLTTCKHDQNSILVTVFYLTLSQVR